MLFEGKKQTEVFHGCILKADLIGDDQVNKYYLI